MPLEGAQGPLDVEDAGQGGGPGHAYGHSVLLGRLLGRPALGLCGGVRPGGVEPHRVLGVRLRAYGLHGFRGGILGLGFRAGPRGCRQGGSGAADVPGEPEGVGEFLGGRVEPGGPQQGGQFTDTGLGGRRRGGGAGGFDGAGGSAGSAGSDTAGHLGRSRRWMRRSARSSRVAGEA